MRSVEGFRPSFWQCLGFQLGNHWPRPRASKLDKGRTCCTANQEFSQKAFPCAHVLGCEMHFCMLLAAFRFRLNNRSCSASLWRDFRLALVFFSGICIHSRNEEGNASDKIFRNVALQVITKCSKTARKELKAVYLWTTLRCCYRAEACLEPATHTGTHSECGSSPS